ncbi:complex I intermediate-associated protein 30 [Lineolata rhizophorae]|uniref:Complex I intermediate-associated protein 30 n=1 Tax=Lineolata rhizophorae TaxID=578093 RepID=A0A6A6NN08_9PEZI|nr:complex I intermediate-associated protein 30 [Lineolata rhizophorae]
MRPTPRLLRRPGFVRRSLDEFLRLSNVAVNLEGLREATKPYHLVSFDSPASIDRCKTMSDRDIGGFSTAHLDFVPGGSASTRDTHHDADAPPHARFHGRISTQLPASSPQVQRTGYAAWRTLDRGASLWGRLLWDTSPYRYLALHVKSDGRAYFVNVQTDSVVPTDIHQHRLFAQRPGEWETVLIPWDDFVRTNYGRVVEPRHEMLRQKVRTVGIGSTDRVVGPFELRVAGIWATNGLEKERGETGEVEKIRGEQVRWTPE